MTEPQRAEKAAWEAMALAMYRGASSIRAWSRHGRRAGVSLEEVTIFRRLLRKRMRAGWKPGGE